jgi:CheY-like chemotaxis protein
VVTPASPPVVLVVERDPDLRHVLRDLLAEEDYRVVDRAMVPELDEFARIRPAAVVLDVAGGRDGDDPDVLAFLRGVAGQHGPGPIPVVVCLGGWDLAAPGRAEVVRLARAVVAKPFDVAGLLAIVARYARPQPVVSPGTGDADR